MLKVSICSIIVTNLQNFLMVYLIYVKFICDIITNTEVAVTGSHLKSIFVLLS